MSRVANFLRKYGAPLPGGRGMTLEGLDHLNKELVKYRVKAIDETELKREVKEGYLRTSTTKIGRQLRKVYYVPIEAAREQGA